jgi:hypothetical protein
MDSQAVLTALQWEEPRLRGYPETRLGKKVDLFDS